MPKIVAGWGKLRISQKTGSNCLSLLMKLGLQAVMPLRFATHTSEARNQFRDMNTNFHAAVELDRTTPYTHCNKPLSLRLYRGEDLKIDAALLLGQHAFRHLLPLQSDRIQLLIALI